jgi:hypothetical protein
MGDRFRGGIRMCRYTGILKGERAAQSTGNGTVHGYTWGCSWKATATARRDGKLRLNRLHRRVRAQWMVPPAMARKPGSRGSSRRRSDWAYCLGFGPRSKGGSELSLVLRLWQMDQCARVSSRSSSMVDAGLRACGQASGRVRSQETVVCIGRS